MAYIKKSLTVNTVILAMFHINRRCLQFWSKRIVRNGDRNRRTPLKHTNSTHTYTTPLTPTPPHSHLHHPTLTYTTPLTPTPPHSDLHHPTQTYTHVNMGEGQAMW